MESKSERESDKGREGGTLTYERRRVNRLCMCLIEYKKKKKKKKYNKDIFFIF